MSTFESVSPQAATTGVLTGKTIGITASRKAEDQAAAFERSGAQVLLAPTVRIVPVEDDAALLEVTEQVIANPPQALLVTTGYGLNGWLEAARARRLEADLLAALEGAEILVRGAKARGAVRALGWQDAGVLEALVQKFKASVIAASVGPVTSEPLEAEGITPLAPERYRLGALIKELIGALSAPGNQGDQA